MNVIYIIVLNTFKLTNNLPKGQHIQGKPCGMAHDCAVEKDTKLPTDTEKPLTDIKKTIRGCPSDARTLLKPFF